MTERWYVLSCAPRKERLIYHQLRDRGFDVYYPYLVARTPNPDTLKIEPYFPGYVFIRVDLDSVAPTTFQWMPLAGGLVCVADVPAFVPDRIIHAIHRRLWKVNSRILGTPGLLDEMDQDDIHSSESSHLFDQQLSGSDRVNALLQMLQSLSLATD